MLNWRTINPGNSPKHLVAGQELSVAMMPGSLSRFAIYAVRTVRRCGEHNEYDQAFVVRDASTVTMDDTKAGKRPDIVFRGSTEDAVILFCRKKMEEDC
jgi:hypothetical protein